MRILALIALCLFVSCGEEVNKMPVPIVPEPMVQPPIREFFAPFLDTFSEEEFDYLVEQVTLYCQGVTSSHTYNSRLKRNLSEASYKRMVNQDDDIEFFQATTEYPFARLDDRSLIRAGIWSKDHKVKNVLFSEDILSSSAVNYVYLQYVDNISIIYLTTVNGHRLIWGDEAYLGWDKYPKKQRAERDSYKNLVIDTWADSGEYIKQNIPSDLNFVLIAVDGTGKPFERKYDRLAIPYDEARRATPDEVEAFNRHFNPKSYDCVE